MSQNAQKILQSELDNIQERIKALKQADPFMDPEHVVDNAAVDTDVREQESHLRIEVELNALNARIDNINKALTRIKKGTYGTCKRCNKTIPAKRLELLPESIYCVSCEADLKR